MKMLYLVVLILVGLFFYVKGMIDCIKETEANKEIEPSASSFMEKIAESRIELIKNVIPEKELSKLSNEEVWIMQIPKEGYVSGFEYYPSSEEFWGHGFWNMKENEYGRTWLAFWDKPENVGEWNAKALTLADFKKRKDKSAWIIKIRPAVVDKIEIEKRNKKPYKITGEKIGSLYFDDYQKKWVAVRNEPELDYQMLQDYFPLNEEENNIEPKEFEKLFRHIGKKAIIEALYSLDKHRAGAMYNRARKIQIKKLKETEKMLKDELETARGLDYLKIQRFLFKLEERRKGLQEKIKED